MPLVSTRGAASAQGFGEFAQSAPANYIEDVFSTWLYTGTGANQTITNGIDLAGKGGLVWIKNRATANHALSDTTALGFGTYVSSNTTAAAVTDLNSFRTFNSNGFTIGSSTVTGASANNYVSWTFREQPKFFDVVTYTGNGVSNREIAHNLGSTPGCIMVKRTDASGNWHVYHISLPADSGAPLLDTSLLLNSTAQALDYRTFANSTFQTDTIFKLGNANIPDINANGATYVAYLFAHNAGGFGLTGTDNVISCGSYTGNGSASGPVVTLGYEPQWLIVKRASGGVASWYLMDNMRGFSVSGSAQSLYPNLSSEEFTSQLCGPTATGFQVLNSSQVLNNLGDTYIYIAIRRGPMKVPTTGTSVFAPVTYTGTGAAGQVTGANFPPDLLWANSRNVGSNNPISVDRLRGNDAWLFRSSTAAETTITNVITSFGQNGIGVGTTATGPVNNSGQQNIFWMYRRAPGFFDEVCYTGSGTTTTQTHNLQAVPELIIVKRRSGTAFWQVYSATYGRNFYAFLNDTQGFASDPGNAWGTTDPTTTTFSLSPLTETNASGSTYVAYLFASCPGVSKVGSFTGTGATQVINCGFTGGARFVLIKAASTTGDWYVWDSARGIVSGNDPYLLINSAAAEVTNTDWVDTAATGFELSNAGGNLANSSGVSYIFLAIA